MKYFLSILSILFYFQLSGQSFSESLRYSVLDYGSTARNLAVGGSMGSLGADISAGAINPAGFAEYPKSEFSFSLGVFNSSIDASLTGNQFSNASKSSFAFNNIALAFSSIPIASPLKSSNFVVGLNKIANFNTEFGYQGMTRGSMTERFIGLADGSFPDELDDFAAGPAYSVGAIFDFEEDNIYETDFDGYEGEVEKSQTVDTKGGINELVIGWAGNLNHKLSFGFSLGMPFMTYEEQKSYFETDNAGNIDFFNELQYDEFLRTSGYGFNGKFGLIIKPQKQIRLSASIHSPTIYYLTDDFYTDITYSFTDQEGAQTFIEPSPDGNFEYRISTPWRASFGAGYIFGFSDLKGFLSAETELVDYSSNSFNLTSDSNNPSDRDLQNDLNRQIDDQFTSVMNWRVGMELAYQAFRVRGGYRIDSSPYKDGQLLDITSFSAGFGFRSNFYFLDIAFQSKSYDEEFSPYFLSDASRIQQVNKDNRFNQVIFTFGYKI